MKVTDILNRRYSTKKFDPSKKISAEDFDQIKSILQMSPSSTNTQPWHFIIAETKEGKKRIAKGTEGFFKFNAPKVENASHVIVFCARTSLDRNYIQHILDQEEKDGRFPNDEIRQGINDSRNMFSDIHKYDLKDQQHWIEKQVYLNVGTLLFGASLLKIDAVPMEGIDFKAIDKEFDLHKKGFTAVVVVSLGYRNESDFNSPDKTPKSRLPQEETMTII